MTYYDSLDEDIARAREILERGRGELLDESLKTIVPPEMYPVTIYGGDVYAAYKLLESFVGEIERLQRLLATEGVEHSECQENVIRLHEQLGELTVKLARTERALWKESEHRNCVVDRYHKLWQATRGPRRIKDA